MAKNKYTHNSYKRAYEDIKFLNSDAARPVRLQLEFLKPEVILQHEHIENGVVCFGSARIREKKVIEAEIAALEKKLNKNPNDKKLSFELKEARGLAKLSKYYDIARTFGRLAVEKSKGKFAVITGGGPGIMEAANRGAFEAGGKSIGFNITLPKEQHPNPYITKGLAFLFHYFAIRKMHLVMRSNAVVAFPGGYGTFDEMFEILTLVQTGKNSPLPIILVGKQFWKDVFNLQKLIDYGVISHLDDIELVDTAEEAWEIIAKKCRI